MEYGTLARSPGGLFEVSIGHGSGLHGVISPAMLYQRPVDGKLFVAAEPGPYVIKVHNTSGGKIEVLLDIDGRDAFSEQAAGLHRRGQVLPPGAVNVFQGFRKDDDSVYAFTFGPLTGGVAELATGSAAGSGIIGVAAYREMPYLPRLRSDYSVAAAAPQTYDAPLTRGMTKSAGGVAPDMSTHLGEEVTDKVGRTYFNRDGEPDVVGIGYASLAALEAAGLTGAGEPVPFKPAANPTGYAALKDRQEAGK